MRKFILAMSALAGFASPIAAAAPDADAATRKDVQCFVLFASAAGSTKDEAAAKASSVGLVYYLGKITRAAPSLDLVEAVKQEMKTLQAGNAQTIGKACEVEFTGRMSDVDKMGKALSAKP